MTPLSDSNGSNRLRGQVAVVSGGAQGIGRAITSLFQREGACVFILDCDVRQGTATADELTKKNPNLPVKFIPVNLRSPDEIRESITVIGKFQSNVDILVNNAGIEIEKSVEQLAVADWDSILEVNLRGAFLLTQAALPLFPGSGGAIVNISSIHATHAFPNSLPYACSKAALVALTRNLALELSPRHIRVNCISPGYIDTRLWDEYLRHSENPKTVAEQTTALHPLGRRGKPADIAEATVFLVSDSSAFITGTELVVDGGLTVRAHP
ncbi:MAG TPA: SDR family oxidoreductase [Terriglobales bacterium]|nr:SDR family oxidoreductase [Terriglobales bacterium]